MIKLKKLLLVPCLAVALTATIGIVASAATVSIDGGTWDRGYTNPGNGYYMGYSYYYHPSKTHGSSVSVSGTIYSSPKTLKGYTSRINAPSTTSKAIQTFYKFY